MRGQKDKRSGTLDSAPIDRAKSFEYFPGESTIEERNAETFSITGNIELQFQGLETFFLTYSYFVAFIGGETECTGCTCAPKFC